MSLFLLWNYTWGDSYIMLFGYRKDGAIEDNLLCLFTKKAEKLDSDKKDNDKDKDMDEDAEDNTLPFQTRVSQLRTSKDIATDKRIMKQFLHSHNLQNPHDIRALLLKRHTLARQLMTM